ncbi:MAG: radical SAM protein, partial [Balneolaceae bacterium]
MNVPFHLVEKYNVPGPRYTSYPTAVEFGADLSKTKQEKRWRNTLQRDRSGPGARGLSLYFHIPFCYSLCWYCGCTKVITRNSDRGDLYLDYLEKEMNLTLDSFDARGPVRQVHFGGGTPTFLRPGQLDRLGELIHERFPVDSETEFSVEIDPRRCDRDRIEALRRMGCNRASLGVQDTNPDVQEAIHRIQPFEMTRDVTAMLRSVGIGRINLDLIYGLPVQTIQSFQQTLD